MKWLSLILIVICAGMVKSQAIDGAWKTSLEDRRTGMLIMNNGYLAFSVFDLSGKQFDYTEGGTYSISNGTLTYTSEFNSRTPERVGTKTLWQVKQNGNELTLSGDPGTLTLSRVDRAADNPMAGTWHITERARDGQGDLVKIHQTGTRKTLKILSATRFQWVAIDPGVKGFYGTGGGTYEAKDGKYTEHIEFFSRDNSRVGASLTFNWKLNNGKWDHSGASSKGDPIHEVWEKIAPAGK